MRSGAKRKWKGTTPGRQNVRRVTDDQLMAMQPHRACLPEESRMSPKATTILGRLNLYGHLTDAQYDAGEKYRAVVAQYCSSIGVPMNGAQTASKGYYCIGAARCESCECRRRKEAYDRAFEAVSRVSQRAARAVAHVAVHDKPDELFYLAIGLDALVKHFGIDTSSRNVTTAMQA